MEWIESIRKAIDYMEENITEELTVEKIAKQIDISPYYFQKGFSMLCGFTVGEYIRKRRLSLAGQDLMSSNKKIIDLAIQYGYDSPDSFTKAFLRFHGVTPLAVRKEGAVVKSYAPLRINLERKGGYTMDYKIEKKEAFQVVGLAKTFAYEKAYTDVPKLWEEFFAKGSNQTICGKYGINNDKEMKGNEFEYMIADDYSEGEEIPEGFVTKTIPAHTWAVFPCIGDTKKTIQEINQKIFQEWLPNARDYTIAEGYFIEMYSNPAEFAKGTQDERYYCEVWIPVKRK